MKTEPDVFSIDDLAAAKNQTECWDGVRNYRARNYLKAMKVGDKAFFYHSNAKPSGIAGIVAISRECYPDHTARDKTSPYFDPRSTEESPRWYMVDVTFERKFERFISLHELKADPSFADFPLTKRGNRLSVMPVESNVWSAILELAAS